MKKVLSVAMASAMVLGMGANAFADLKYYTDAASPKEMALPAGMEIKGDLFVTDKNNNLVKGSHTALNNTTAIDFQPGDTVWMPLYADNQLSYTVEGYNKGQAAQEAVNEVLLGEEFITDKQDQVVAHTADDIYFVTDGKTNFYVEDLGTLNLNADGSFNGAMVEGTDYKKVSTSDIYAMAKDKYYAFTVGGASATALPVATSDKEYVFTRAAITAITPAKVTIPDTVAVDGIDREVLSYRIVDKATGKNLSKDDLNKLNAGLNGYLYGKNDIYVVLNLKPVKAIAGTNGEIVIDKVVDDVAVTLVDGKVVKAHGHYTGEIGKNWSVNLVEADNELLEQFVEKAELHKVDRKEALSYDIMPNSVWVKVQLKKEWKNCDTANLKYYVYVADQKGAKTNKVWVSGKYAADVKDIDFTWSNDASVAGLWKANDNGVAVFDFADKAFFTVKMYKGECIYLDLATAYNAAIDNEFDSDIDEFFLFDTEKANFNRSGELVLVSDDADKVVYEVADDEIYDMEAEYVENYAIAHTNKRVNGYKFNTADLGKYVLADEIVVEDEEEAEEEDKAEEVKPSEDAKEETVKPNKVNPNTGANDFVGLAVSLAVVSVAAAGALALKK